MALSMRLVRIWRMREGSAQTGGSASISVQDSERWMFFTDAFFRHVLRTSEMSEAAFAKWGSMESL